MPLPALANAWHRAGAQQMCCEEVLYFLYYVGIRVELKSHQGGKRAQGQVNGLNDDTDEQRQHHLNTVVNRDNGLNTIGKIQLCVLKGVKPCPTLSPGPPCDWRK